MQKIWNAALVAAFAATGCTVDARSPGDERHEFSRGEPAEGEPAAPECTLHSDCPSGQACMNGQCAVTEAPAPDAAAPAPDAGAPEADAAPEEPDASPEPEPDAPACTPTDEVCDGSDNDCDGAVDEDCPPADAAPEEPDASPEPEPDAPPCTPTDEVCDGSDNDCDGAVDEDCPAADAAPPVPDAGAPSADATPPVPDATPPAPDAGAPDAPPPPPLSVTVVIEVPEGETVDASAQFCSTFGGGWACAPFALGGTSGREIRATFADVVPAQHSFNACLRLCDDPVNGVWMAYQSDGLQQRDDPDVFVNEVVVPESIANNGGLGANWVVDTRPPSAPDGG